MYSNCMCRKSQQFAHFLWIDNFSKFIARSIPTTDKGVYSQCLWTGVAVFHSDKTTYSDEIKYDEYKQMVPAMPGNLLQHRPSVETTVRNVLTFGNECYDNSLVCKFDVRNIPLKIDTNEYPDVADDINSFNMKNVRPLKLLDMNVGSNRGLICVLKNVMEMYGIDNTSSCNRYVNVNVDENIYWRILKVLEIQFFTHLFLQ